jgi:hypothetical protein
LRVGERVVAVAGRAGHDRGDGLRAPAGVGGFGSVGGEDQAVLQDVHLVEPVVLPGAEVEPVLAPPVDQFAFGEA